MYVMRVRMRIPVVDMTDIKYGHVDASSLVCVDTIYEYFRLIKNKISIDYWTFLLMTP
jgi:hypothetical protein